MIVQSFDVLVIGGGTAGLSAYRKLTANGWNVGLVEPNDITTTCARVGCMPSKLLIAAADAAHVVDTAGVFGIDVKGWSINQSVLWNRVQSERDRFVGFVQRGAATIPVIKGWATFIDKNTIRVESNGQVTHQLTAEAFVLATGSRPIVPSVFHPVLADIHTNESIFELQEVPKRLAVFGAGVIGVELGMAMKHLGSDVHLFNLGDKFLGLNPELNAYWTNVLANTLHLHVRTNVARIEKLPADNKKGFVFSLDYGGDPVIVDDILVATGRRVNLELIANSHPDLTLADYNRHTTQLGESNLFLAGDVNNDIPLLHEASKEGDIAAASVSAYLVGDRIVAKKRLVPLSVVFSSPQVISVGTTTITADTIVGQVSFEDQGRSRVMAKNVGMAQLYFDATSRKLIGAQMIGPDAEHIGHLLAWSIQNDNTIDQLLDMPFYHPVVEEGIRTAIRDAYAKF